MGSIEQLPFPPPRFEHWFRFEWNLSLQRKFKSRSHTLKSDHQCFLYEGQKHLSPSRNSDYQAKKIVFPHNWKVLGSQRLFFTVRFISISIQSPSLSGQKFPLPPVWSLCKRFIFASHWYLKYKESLVKSQTVIPLLHKYPHWLYWDFQHKGYPNLTLSLQAHISGLSACCKGCTSQRMPPNHLIYFLSLFENVCRRKLGS